MSRRPRGLGLNVDRLVELDLAFLGPRAIVAEFAAGVAGCLLLGVFSLAFAARAHAPLVSWPVLIGLELSAVGLNYIPLLGAVLRKRQDTSAIAATKTAIRDSPDEARSYGLRQAWILIPGAVLLFALIGRRRSAETNVTPEPSTPSR